MIPIPDNTRPQEAMWQDIHAARPGGSVGYVGVPHGVALDGWDRFFTHVRLHGGPRRCAATCRS
jgi:threonine dehydrogenase-like Zn-dependent dehydrogenase